MERTSVMKSKNILAGLVLASSGFVSMAASAAVISEWDWVSDGGFVIGAGTCNNSAAGACLAYTNDGAVTPSGIDGTASVMTWGIPTVNATHPSGLQAVFGSSADGSAPIDVTLLGSKPTTIPAFEKIQTNGDWTTTGAAIHYNNEITTAGGHMNYSELVTSFQLLPGGAILGPEPIYITFDETYNESRVANCPEPNPHQTRCDDVFTVTPLPESTTFYVGSQLYKLSFRYLAGPGAIMDGDTIYTAEKYPGTAILFTQARISTIPVPGVLALLGMGLLMLGWRVRKTA